MARITYDNTEWHIRCTVLRIDGFRQYWLARDCEMIYDPTAGRVMAFPLGHFVVVSRIYAQFFGPTDISYTIWTVPTSVWYPDLTVPADAYNVKIGEYSNTRLDRTYRESVIRKAPDYYDKMLLENLGKV